MTREKMAAVLEEIALLLEWKGENPFKIRAYRQGAEIVRNHDADIVRLAAENQLADIKGIGEALAEKLHKLATDGTLDFHRQLREGIPDSLFELFDPQGLGSKKVKVLYHTLGITSVAELKTACEAGQVAGLPGFGAKTQAALLESVRHHQQSAGRFRQGDIAALASEILATLRVHPEISRAAVAGSFRRAKETVADLDFLVATREGALVCEDFTTLPQVKSVIACGDTKASVVLQNGMQCDLRAVTNAQFPFALQYFTGSKEHNVALRSLALKQGWSLNEYELSPAGDNSADPPADIHEETDLYRFLGISFIEPELRENRGEIEAARDGELPRLVALDHLRGTFHNHTTASDGRNTLAEMAAEAIELGLQYLGIADHSKSTVIANGLDEERLASQIAEIRRLNDTFDGFRLFAGSEVDILRDGSLDFDDQTLASLDYCVASVHNHFQLDETEMTRRICRAMENPHVTMLGHLTGRLLLIRDGYPVNHEAIIDCAAETRTVIELNCNPRRLDMDWRWWRRARDQGVLCAINPDAHTTTGLHHLALGIRLARKGWLRREDVLNTRPAAGITTFLNTPKHQR